MRTSIFRKFSAREWTLALTAALVLGGVPLVKRVLVPEVARLQSLWRDIRQMHSELALLHENIALRERVDAAYAQLNDAAVQRESDEVTLSAFLKGVEEIASRIGVQVVNMKPLPADTARTYKTYRVRVAIAGRLSDVTRFTAELMNGQRVTGLDSFSVRGVQDGPAVECTLQLWMVQLLPPEMQPKPSPPKPTPQLAKGGR